MSQIPTPIMTSLPEIQPFVPTNWGVKALGSKLEKKLMHYMIKAINEYKMIVPGDKIMVCLSGGKDSFTLLSLLNLYRAKTKNAFTIHAYTLDQKQPGWDDSRLQSYLQHQHIPYTIESRDTYSVVVEKIPENKTYCSLCSRLRRGNIYRHAKENGYTKIALGHHRDDMIQTLLMSLFFSGKISSMPPKLLTDNKQHIVIRPLAFCQEADIKQYSIERNYPIIPCTLCGSQENLMRKKIKKLLESLSQDNPKIPSNMLHALSNVHPSQLMDKNLWDFAALDAKREQDTEFEDVLEELF